MLYLRAALLGCGLALPLLLGCKSGKETPPGEIVTGKVTVKNKEPGTFLSIEFVSATDATQKGQGGVDPTGRFSGRAPRGKCLVALRPAGGGGPGGPGGPGPGGNPYGPGGPKGGPPPMGGGGPPMGGGGPPKGGDAPGKTRDAVEISAKSRDAKTSGVEIDVPAGGAKELMIDFSK